jgi:hypothetical protein
VRFTSKYAGLQVPCVDEQVAFNADGQKRVIRPYICADFGDPSLEHSASFGEEVYISDIDGERSPVADIRGGIYDTDAAARVHGWTDAEKEQVEAKLLSMCPNNPDGEVHHRTMIGYGDVEIYEPPVLSPPWPKYEEAKPAQIPAMAEAFGCVNEALTYEQRRPESRPEVVAELEKLAAAAREAATLEAVEA